jgi:hypothetical protein
MCSNEGVFLSVRRLLFFVLLDVSGQIVLAALYENDAEKYGEDEQIKKTSSTCRVVVTPFPTLDCMLSRATPRLGNDTLRKTNAMSKNF